ncbi:RsmB/NOP family class I SAM-dependent RNA methyltransferase [Parvularcula bermudensis]|uniref:RsmB/NOP family class I SAM-dependent RNA methyltransferase n=1 Tax=Parvularcula bermudensis TaxID=208216 RepID=UPI000326BFC9|nr:RsmB/NOP family class I SAM-dependent RNA methyltransferase [Parvularcula bermudensis]
MPPHRFTRSSTLTPAPSDEPGLPARRAALDILLAIRRGQALDMAMAESEAFEDLEGADRGFARTLIMAVLRRQNTLDEAYGTFLDRPLKSTQGTVITLLRLAAAQILLLGVPPHAATATTVDLAKERRDSAGFAKLLNALCRRMVEKGPSLIEDYPPRTDVPGWLWRRLERHYGAKTARRLAAAFVQEPALDLTPKDPKERERLATALEAHPLGPVSLRRTAGGRIEDLPGYTEGDWWIQDLAAALPISLLGDLTGQRVYDLCAAPGGKTAQLAAAGAHVTAVDISAKRLRRLEDNLARLGLRADTFVGDVLGFSPDEPADLVVLDAPCTATGTVRRHPDLLWSKKEEDVAELSALQDQMLHHAARLVRPGGRLMFITCSLLAEEGEDRSRAFLSRHSQFTAEPLSDDEKERLGPLNAAKDGHLRTRPDLIADAGGMDGFYAARFTRQD